jgi:hypothetical protein
MNHQLMETSTPSKPIVFDTTLRCNVNGYYKAGSVEEVKSAKRQQHGDQVAH